MTQTTYLAQRKVIAWESVYVEADTFREAVDKALSLDDAEWYPEMESFDATEDLWLQDQTTKDIATYESYTLTIN